MSVHDAGAEECKGCGAAVEIETAIKLIVERDEEQIWTVLCPDCAVVECTNCGIDVPIESVLDDREGIWDSRPIVDCNRCDETVPVADAVELRNDQDRSYRRRLCADCFENVAVPPGYRVVRDFAP